MLRPSMFNESNETKDDFGSQVENIFDHYFRANQAAMSTESSQEDEIEKVWFIKIDDFSQFEKSILTEHHVQWEYRLKDPDGKPLGTERSREINHGERYELTIKSYRKDGAGSVETTLDSTAEMHEVISNLADRALHKTRYLVPSGVMVEVMDEKGEPTEKELIWEVDAFLMEDGSFYPWVKIDLEVPHENVDSPGLPFKYVDAINVSYDVTVTEEQRAIVDSIFDAVKRSK
ncbi:MAG: hypothetical protein CL582_04455 [Alteromonadaceae bacterium]|nr:hypothetical protein [Alteromonadaceae bacterium]